MSKGPGAPPRPGRLDSATRFAALLGHPVSHSLSPALHNAAFREIGLNAAYLAFDVPPEALRAAVAGLSALGAAGANVTVPHKERVLQIADAVSPEAERIGSANTLVFAAGGVHAHTTDPEGVLGGLRALGVEPAGRTVLVLGAGGAGRAAAWTVGGAGSKRVLLANRSGDRAKAAAVHLGGPVEALALEGIRSAAQEVDLVVNATSAELSGGTVLGPEVLRRLAARGAALLDLVYAPGETALVREARNCGMRAVDGLETLVVQAGASFELVWGVGAPVARMRQAADEAAGRAPEKR
ncbi:MAG TPA: shikimate dehydrogenase [Actinomycetota bacterium]|nr:shikimate dehydrogenase [Actinomycetota bacterium]